MPARRMQPETSSARPSWLAGLFGVDRRSLACFRIGLGLLLLADLFGRARTLRMHYTGEGVYPLELAAEMRPDSSLFHLFMLSDEVALQGLLFGVFALLAVLLVLGWHTRIVSVLSFLFLAALVRRNHWVCHTGDAWLKALSFWAMFLPLGAHLSVDRLRSRWHAPRGAPVLGLATAGVLLQIALFYVMAGYLKTRYEVWTRGDAVWVFTHVIEYTRPLGAWLGRSSGVCRFLTFATLVLEGLAPFLLFFPLWTARLRIALFCMFAAFHLTLQAAIHIGIFQLTCIVAMTLFLPAVFWEALARAVPGRVRRAWEALCLSVAGRLGVAKRAAMPQPSLLGRAGSVVIVPVLAVVIASNVNSAVRDPYDREDRGPLPLPQWIDDYGREMSLVQSWNMFTDIDRLFFGWFLVVARQEDGTMVDVLERRPFQELALPEGYARTFQNHNSRRYWREMAQPGREFLQKPQCDYLAREWQREGRPALTHMAIFHVGRIPSQDSARDQVKPVCTQWEGEHEPLKQAAPEVRARWIEAREEWNRFLKSLPKTVAAAR